MKNTGTILVDARGLSCPQPAYLTRQTLAQAVASWVEVLVDTAAQRDNVVRVAKKSGWSAQSMETEDGSIKICLKKQEIVSAL